MPRRQICDALLLSKRWSFHIKDNDSQQDRICFDFFAKSVNAVFYNSANCVATYAWCMVLNRLIEVEQVLFLFCRIHLFIYLFIYSLLHGLRMLCEFIAQFSAQVKHEDAYFPQNLQGKMTNKIMNKLEIRYSMNGFRDKEDSNFLVS